MQVWPTLIAGIIFMHRARKTTVYSLSVLFFCILAWMIYLDCYFYAYSPRAPDPSHGFVYKTTVHHGATVYLNAKQWRWFSPRALSVYFTAEALIILLIAVLAKKWRL